MEQPICLNKEILTNVLSIAVFIAGILMASIHIADYPVCNVHKPSIVPMTSSLFQIMLLNSLPLLVFGIILGWARTPLIKPGIWLFIAFLLLNIITDPFITYICPPEWVGFYPALKLLCAGIGLLIGNRSASNARKTT